jgi:hypothetical protein
MPDTTPAGVYELSDARQRLKTLSFVVNEALQDGSDEQQMIFSLIDTIEEKLDAAEKAIEAHAPERDKVA